MTPTPVSVMNYRSNGICALLTVSCLSGRVGSQSSPSGNMHGMPLGLLLHPDQCCPSLLPGFDWLFNGKKHAVSSTVPMDPSQLVLIGLRDVDQPEKDMIRHMGILALTMADVDRIGIGRLVMS
jgi:arginase